MHRILFITKKRSGYGGYGSYGHKASGLHNSAKFVVDMLVDSGVDAKLADVIDNNDIDREVTAFRPHTVIVEAFWVVPDKFDILSKLHPSVKWIIRGHSDIPFLANEGVAFEWIEEYLWRDNVYLAFNSPRVVEDVKALTCAAHRHKVLYLPNFYPTKKQYRKHHKSDYFLKVGCFGAIRPMKNQLVQAVAAIRYANKIGKILHFHVNATRCEQGGDNVLKNLRALFANSRHELIEERWLNHEQFLHTVRKMDFAMAVSFSETFCITAADAVAVGVPLICSVEIPWASTLSLVPITDAGPIVEKFEDLDGWFGRLSVILNLRGLRRYAAKSKKIWLKHFGK